MKIYTITPIASPQVTGLYNINVARTLPNKHIRSRDFVVDEDLAERFANAIKDPAITFNGGLIEIWGVVQ